VLGWDENKTTKHPHKSKENFEAVLWNLNAVLIHLWCIIIIYAVFLSRGTCTAQDSCICSTFSTCSSLYSLRLPFSATTWRGWSQTVKSVSSDLVSLFTELLMQQQWRRSCSALTWHIRSDQLMRPSKAVYHHLQTVAISAVPHRCLLILKFAVFISVCGLPKWLSSIVPSICFWHVLHTTSTHTTNRQYALANFEYWWLTQVGRDDKELNYV